MAMKHQLYLEEFYKISQQMCSEHNLEKLLELIMDSSIKVTDANEGSLMLLDKLSQTLKIMVAKGLSEETKESVVIKIGEPIAGIVAKDGKPLILSDELLENKRFANLHHEGRRIRSAISLPLKVKDKVIGVLNLNITEKEGRFTDDDLIPLSIFASQAAIAIENARLYSATTKRTQELLILNRAGKILSSTFQEEEVIKIITNVIGEIVDFDVVASLLLETREYSTLRLISFCKLNNKAIEAVKNRFTAVLSELTDWEFEKNQMTIKREVKKKETAISCGELKSHLVFPLVAKEKVIGAISIHSFKPQAFSEEHIHSLAILAPQAAIALENARIYLKMQNLYTETIKALACEIETRNPYTLGHSERVTDYSVNIAKKMGLASTQVELIRYAGLLHDLGKIGISDSILLKPDKLSPEEFEEIKSHPTKSESIIKMITFLKDALPIVRHHHEYYDGKGYPDGLKEYEIPIESRILAVADAFDAMTSDRPYRKAMKKDEAHSILKRFSGQQFDPDVVTAFLSSDQNE